MGKYRLAKSKEFSQPCATSCGNSDNIIRSLTGTVSADIAQWKIQKEIKTWKSLQDPFQSHGTIPNLQCSAIGTVPKHDPREYQLNTYLIRPVGQLTMEYCMNIALSHVIDEAVVLVAKTHLSLLDAMIMGDMQHHLLGNPQGATEARGSLP